ncbi:hypothetical protein [Sphingobacterium sp. MYb382]|uniref:hypothetical protein n=1 Tax=Sphingobacterium sp. MYb382 TaxID=2745278 RepID=UPI00309CF0D4
MKQLNRILFVVSMGVQTITIFSLSALGMHTAVQIAKETFLASKYLNGELFYHME